MTLNGHVLISKLMETLLGQVSVTFSSVELGARAALYEPDGLGKREGRESGPSVER